MWVPVSPYYDPPSVYQTFLSLLIWWVKNFLSLYFQWKFNSSFPIFIPLLSLLALATTSRTTLNNHSEYEYPCIVPDFHGKGLDVTIKHAFISWVWDIGICHVMEVSIYSYFIKRLIFIYIFYQEWSLNFSSAFHHLISLFLTLLTNKAVYPTISGFSPLLDPSRCPPCRC